MASSLPSASLGSAEGTCSSGHGKQCCEYHGLLISSRLAWTATNACLRAVAAVVNEQHIAVLRGSNQAPQRSLDVAAGGLGGGLVGVNHDGDIGGLEAVVGGKDILDRVNCGGTQYIAVVSIALQQASSSPSESTDDSPAVLTIIDTPASSEGMHRVSTRLHSIPQDMHSVHHEPTPSVRRWSPAVLIQKPTMANGPHRRRQAGRGKQWAQIGNLPSLKFCQILATHVVAADEHGLLGRHDGDGFAGLQRCASARSNNQ